MSPQNALLAQELFRAARCVSQVAFPSLLVCALGSCLDSWVSTVKMCQVSSLTPLFLPQNKLDGGLGIWVKIWTKECCLSGCTKQIIQRIDDVGLYFNPQTDQPSEKHAALRIIHMVVLKPAEITFSTRQLRGILFTSIMAFQGKAFLSFGILKGVWRGHGRSSLKNGSTHLEQKQNVEFSLLSLADW